MLMTSLTRLTYFPVKRIQFRQGCVEIQGEDEKEEADEAADAVDQPQSHKYNLKHNISSMKIFTIEPCLLNGNVWLWLKYCPYVVG